MDFIRGIKSRARASSQSYLSCLRRRVLAATFSLTFIVLRKQQSPPGRLSLSCCESACPLATGAFHHCGVLFLAPWQMWEPGPAWILDAGTCWWCSAGHSLALLLLLQRCKNRRWCKLLLTLAKRRSNPSRRCCTGLQLK